MMNRKRQILEHLINDLYEQYWEMIELAVESSDMGGLIAVMRTIEQKAGRERL